MKIKTSKKYASAITKYLEYLDQRILYIKKGILHTSLEEEIFIIKTLHNIHKIFRKYEKIHYLMFGKTATRRTLIKKYAHEIFKEITDAENINLIKYPYNDEGNYVL